MRSKLFLIFISFYFSGFAQFETPAKLCDSVWGMLRVGLGDSVYRLMPDSKAILLARKDSGIVDQVNVLHTRSELVYRFKSDYKVMRKSAQRMGIDFEFSIVDDIQIAKQKHPKGNIFYAEILCHQGKKGFLIRFTGLELGKLWYLGDEIGLDRRIYVPEPTEAEIEQEILKYQRERKQNREKVLRERKKARMKRDAELKKINQRDSSFKALQERIRKVDSVKMYRNDAQLQRSDSLQKAKLEREEKKMAMKISQQFRKDSLAQLRANLKQQRLDSIQKVKDEILRRKEEIARERLKKQTPAKKPAPGKPQNKKQNKSMQYIRKEYN